MKKRFLFRVFVGASSWPVIATSKKVAKAKFIDRKLDEGKPDDVILEREITSEDEAMEKAIDKAQLVSQESARNKKIAACVETVENWSIENLIEYAQDAMKERLDRATDKEIDVDYEQMCEPF